MHILGQGGWMMYPLGLVSVLALTIMVERFLFYSALAFPAKQHMATLEEAVQKVKKADGIEHIVGLVPNLALFAPFVQALRFQGSEKDHEALLQLAGEGIIASCGARLGLLAILVRVAPLMGLLGTVLGMITTFSKLADHAGGVDMTILAGGIWQALLTTATGLVIAIPALMAQHYYMGKQARVASALEQMGHVALALSHKDRA